MKFKQYLEPFIEGFTHCIEKGFGYILLGMALQALAGYLI